jgi:hypothetical protein
MVPEVSLPRSQELSTCTYPEPDKPMKNGVFWDVRPCGSCNNGRFEELTAPIISVTRIGELGISLAVTSNRRTLRRNTSLRQLLVTANVVPSLPTFLSETSVLTRATRRNIQEDDILHSRRRENLKSFTDQSIPHHPMLSLK